MTATWDIADQNAALAEGWDIFLCSDVEREPFELQRLDYPEEHGAEAEAFDDDVDAWRHVHRLACEGSPLHNRALAFLAEHSPVEFIHIATWLHDNPEDAP